MCRQRVRECDVLVGIVAHQRSWIPAQDEGGDGDRSITWLEVEEARSRGIPVLAYSVNPETLGSPGLLDDSEKRLHHDRDARFREYLSSDLRGEFSDPGELTTLLAQALQKVSTRR